MKSRIPEEALDPRVILQEEKIMKRGGACKHEKVNNEALKNEEVKIGRIKFNLHEYFRCFSLMETF